MEPLVYVNPDTREFPVTVENIRGRVDMLFGDVPPESALRQLGMFLTVPDDVPSFNPDTQYIEMVYPVKTGDDWVRGWKVTNFPPPPPIHLPADVLYFDRMTDDEFDDLDAAVRAGETARVYRGWVAATVFIERTDMWNLLVKHLTPVVSAARLAELLAPVEAARMEAEVTE